MTRIMLRIDKLVLHSIDREDARAVSAGMQAESQLLLAETGPDNALSQGGDRACIRSDGVEVTPGGNARHMGRTSAGGIAKEAKS